MTNVLPPGIRTYKPRRGRVSAREYAAIEAAPAWLLPAHGDLIDAGLMWGRQVPVVVEIGFGTGAATAQMAQDDPETGILAIDIHTPGIGDLLMQIDKRHLTNVRVIEGDALTVLQERIPEHSLAGVRSYFPDPWPKARHHKRRLVQPAVLDLIASRVITGGTWHLATDWEPYAESMLDVFAADPTWTGGVIERPSWRPITHYERRALREGRPIFDLMFRTA